MLVIHAGKTYFTKNSLFLRFYFIIKREVILLEVIKNHFFIEKEKLYEKGYMFIFRIFITFIIFHDNICTRNKLPR